MRDLAELPDASVVAAVLTGNIDAYGVLVARYREAYTRFAARMLGSPEDADDALQLSFVRAFRNLSQCRDPDRFGAWLYLIVVNQCRTIAARRARRERRFSDNDADLQNAPTPHPAAESELRDEIQYALDQLESSQREAFLLRYVEGLGYEEISEITGVGVSALKMRAMRATERLRSLLKGVGS